ncbi:MAG: dephospho-CoA kinase [Lachnospiraceae bacterium]|nr:dephospho-CoA kinase [Lachnospiraceae bacterium]
MRIIGITGGIGTGKSTILNILKTDYNAYIVETDKLAHSLMLPGKVAYKQIVESFGSTILQEGGMIDRQMLGSIVFRDKAALQRLNGIVHPAVKSYIRDDIALKKQEGVVDYYVIEAALLIEDGYKAICDELWYIYANQDVRLARLLDGRGGDEQKWIDIMANQATDVYYQEHCDVTIDNGKDIENTILQVKQLLYK